MNFYNATSHKNIFFGIKKNDGKITKKRNGIFFTMDEVEPSFVLEKEIPLETPRESVNSFSFFKNYEEFDAILCSQKFANFAVANYLQTHPGFVDRLCILVPLFTSEDAQKKIGSVGIKKACAPLRSMSSYYELLVSGAKAEAINKIVSPFAVSVAMDEDVKNHPSSFWRNTRFQELQYYLQEKGMNQFSQDGLRFFCA